MTHVARLLGETTAEAAGTAAVTTAEATGSLAVTRLGAHAGLRRIVSNGPFTNSTRSILPDEGHIGERTEGTNNVARLAAAVALATGTAEASTAGTARGGALGAGRGDVALLAARVAGLGLGGGALRGSERFLVGLIGSIDSIGSEEQR
jgi:hypothetical protein